MVKTKTKLLLSSLLLWCGTVHAQENIGTVRDHLEINIGGGHGRVQGDKPTEGYYYYIGAKGKIHAFNEHLRLVATTSVGHSTYRGFPEELTMMTNTIGLESRAKFARHCSYFNEISLGLTAKQGNGDINMIDISAKAAAGVMFDCGLTIGLQLHCVPTYKSYNTYYYTNYQEQKTLSQLFMLSLQVGWYIF